MIKRKPVAKSSKVKVAFALDKDDPRLPAAVLGDFNQWDFDADPLKPRSNDTWSAVVMLEKGKTYHFRYRSLGGQWFNDDQADGFEVDKHGNPNCVLRT